MPPLKPTLRIALIVITLAALSIPRLADAASRATAPGKPAIAVLMPALPFLIF